MSERDNQLIAEYNGRSSEEAFAALVRQHVNLVFATAMRQVGNRETAEEITQNVFVALAQAAGKLGSHPTIAGWLHQTTLNKSREWLRSELRRRKREQVAVNLETARAEGGSVWAPLAPLLDEALLKLREPDRQAVILHYLEGRSFQDVGSVLGVGEDAARKRVNRCLDELTHFFRHRGFAVPTLVAGAPLFALSAHAAPAGLAASATTAGLAAAHSAASTSILTLIKGALNIMAWTKAKTVIVVGVGLLLAAGTTTFTIKEIAHHREESVWSHITRCDLKQMESAPPTVSIRPTRFARSSVGQGRDGNGKVLGLHVPFDAVLARAYDVTPSRVLALTPLPQGTFDYIANVSRQPTEALQEMIRQKYGIIGRREKRETDVLLLTMKRRGASGLKPAPLTQRNDISSAQVGHFHYSHCPISTLVFDLEFWLHVPVIDRTGLDGDYDFDLKWNDEILWDAAEHRSLSNPGGLKQVLLDQLGLELVPGREPIEMLVVEKAN